MNSGGFLDLNGSFGMIGGLGRAQAADSRALEPGIEPFRAAVKDPNCFGDDELGRTMKENYPSGDDIDDNCTMQKSCVENGEALGQGIIEALGMLEEVVLQGEKNVNRTESA